MDDGRCSFPAIIAAAAAILSTLSIPAFAATAPVISSISNPVLAGDAFTITGSGFTAGSVANFFVSTSNGAINFGPLTPSARSATSLTIPVPASRITTMGNGLVTVVVVNTDQGFTQSNGATAQLFGDIRDGFPNLTTIDGVALDATSSIYAGDNVTAIIHQNQTVALGGTGFDTANGVAVDLFCDCPGGKIPTIFLPPGDPRLTATALFFTVPSSATTGPGWFVVTNSGPRGDYSIHSNIVSVPIGDTLNVFSVSQSGCTVTVNGTGFAIPAAGIPPLTVINLFNTQSGGVVNLGGLTPSVTPRIPLTVTSPNQLSFSLAGTDFAPGASFVQVLNPPFVPFTTTSANGSFTAAACTPGTPTPMPSPSSTTGTGPTPTPATSTSLPTPSAAATPALTGQILETGNCSGAVTAYPENGNGDITPVFPLKTELANPGALARDKSGRLYVANSGCDTINIYAAGAGGNVAPVAVLGGTNTGIAGLSGVAVDSLGKIYVLNQAILASIEIFAAGSQGNASPAVVISGKNTGLSDPVSIFVAPDGKIYVANVTGSINVYAAGSSGDAAPIATISGANTGFTQPVGVAVDSRGQIYITDQANNSVSVFAAGSNGNASPSAVIAGSNTGLFSPLAIALDSNSNIYVANSELPSTACSPPSSCLTRGRVTVYKAGSDGNVSPIAAIEGSNTGLADSGGIAVDSSLNIYVTNTYGGAGQKGSITIYAAGSSGNSTPSASIINPDVGLSGPRNIGVGSGGKIYVVNTPPLSTASSITVYPAGSAAGVAPIATITGPHTMLTNPSAVAVDAKGKIYVSNQPSSPGGASSVLVYPAGSNGDATPAAVITGSNTELFSPVALALDSAQNLYVGNIGDHSVKVYPAGSSGNVTPSASISTACKPNASDPFRSGELSSIALDSARNIYVGCIDPAAVNVFAAGANGSPAPIATISGSSSGVTGPSGIALDPLGDIYVADGSILVFAPGSNGNVAPIRAIGGPHTPATLVGNAIAIEP